MTSKKQTMSHTKLEHENFNQICQLLLDFGRKAVLKVLDENAKPSSVQELILNCKPDFKKFKRKVLNTTQWKLLYPDDKVGLCSDQRFGLKGEFWNTSERI